MQQQVIYNGNETTLAKWGRRKMPWLVLPAVAGLRAREVNEVVLKPICALQKTMSCIQVGKNRKCNVSKKAWLVSIHQLKLDGNKALREYVGAYVSVNSHDHYWSINKFPVNLLLKIVDIANTNEACASAVQLL